MNDSKAYNVFRNLASIDVNKHASKKGKFTYLSWTWAWATLMEEYPASTYEFLPNEIHNDDSVTVHCTVTVEGISRTMWLAVMDNNNRAIKNPASTDIANNKMRCLVKALAMFGLGHYIYAGESMPEVDLYSELHLVLKSGTPLDLIDHLDGLSDTDQSEAFNGAPKGQKQAFKDQVRDRTKAAHAALDEITDTLRVCINNDDKAGIDEIWDDVTNFQKKLIGARLTEVEKHAAAAIRAAGDVEAPEGVIHYLEKRGE